MAKKMIAMSNESVEHFIQSLETAVDHFRPSRGSDMHIFKDKDRIYIRQSIEVSGGASNEDMQFSKDDDPIEAIHSVKFEMEYMVRKFSRSVRVRWRPRHVIRYCIDPDTNLRDESREIREFYGDKEEWREIGDHDSCWRGCSSTLKQWIREKFDSDQSFDHVHSHYSADYFHILHEV